MSRFLHRLGLASFRHRLAFILAWVAVLVALGVGSATLSGETVNEFRIPGQESTTAFELMQERFGSGTSNASAQIVLQAPAGQTLTNPENASKVAGIVADLSELPGVVNASNPLDATAPTIAADQRTAFSTVSYGVPVLELTPEEQEALGKAVEDARSTGLTVEMAGEAAQEQTEPGGSAELIGVVIALIVLIITYGTLAAAGMNLITALIGVAAGALGVTVATGFMDLQATTPILAVMLGLAVGIDYALFIVTRFRSELRSGKDIESAVSMAVGTAGSAVVTAGLSVVIALVGLLVVGIPFLGEMGVAAAATVVIAVLVAITLVPASLSYLGKRALPKKERKSLGTVPTADDNERGFYKSWANGVTKRPWLALLAAIVALGVIAIPTLSMKTTLAVAPPDDSTQGRATKLLDDNFGPGTTNPIIVFIDGAGAAERAVVVAAEAAKLPDVVVAMPGGATPDGSAALVTVIPKSGPADDATAALVRSLRDTTQQVESPRSYVTGVTAITIDITEKLNRALPIYLLLVVGLALILLILVFRSVLVPLVGVLGFLLTIGASFGATVAVFQWGWLADVFGVPSVGPIMSLMPILVVGILFGLAMDYQVFLVSRMHEEHAHGASPRDAITVGFRHAAPVVTAAATIMFAVFAGFISEPDAIIKSIGFALAVGIFFDAIIVRMVIMPAALAILGKAAWWFPSWLEWLPHLDVEGEALKEERKSPELRA